MPQKNSKAAATKAAAKSASTRAKNLKNKIMIPKEASNVDPFLRMTVAFHLDGPERPQWLSGDAYLPLGKNIGLSVNLENNMVAMGWIDGNPVHLITTADGTELSHVKRRVEREQQQQSAPMALRKYNRGMQAVDRFDQLMSLYSLAKRHAFKKWYLKLTMALIDVGMVNAERHYFMVNQEETKGDYRYYYQEKLCSQLFDTNWSLYEGMTNNEVLVAMVEDDDSCTMQFLGF